MINVYTLLYARTEEDVAGNTLFFSTVKKGFPNSNIHVFDNNNSAQLQAIFSEKTEDIGGVFSSLEKEVYHHAFIANLIELNSEPFYLIDPDTIWFDSMQTDFDSAIAGRLIPGFYEEFNQANLFPRIHTSCIYINPKEFKNLAASVKQSSSNLIDPYSFCWEDIWYKFDTFSKFYCAFSGHCKNFSESENNKFAHLFCGTHISSVKDKMPILLDMHQQTLQNMKYAQNLHKIQNEYFTQFPWKKTNLFVNDSNAGGLTKL